VARTRHLVLGCAAVGTPPAGWPTGLGHPEALSPTNAKEADDICELLGPYVAAAMYSKVWQLREAALQQLEAFVGNQVISHSWSSENPSVACPGVLGGGIFATL
jgi:hypothetical protein